jgi:large subunit ribosomal protein L11
MADKKVKTVIKMVIQAGNAQPKPPVGSTLGPTGVNLMQFCKEFNDRTATMVGLVPVVVTIFEDRSFEFITKTAPVSELIKQAVGITSGSSDALRKKVASISKAKIREIAEKKMVDLNCYTVESAEKQVIGTCRSMGVSIEA